VTVLGNLLSVPGAGCHPGVLARLFSEPSMPTLLLSVPVSLRMPMSWLVV
jgi:hypothetical protein